MPGGGGVPRRCVRCRTSPTIGAGPSGLLGLPPGWIFAERVDRPVQWCEPAHQAVQDLVGEPVGAEYCGTSCDLGVFVKEAAESVSSGDLDVGVDRIG
jgi:hypothetical protein